MQVTQRQSIGNRIRRGAAAVELAIVAPIFLLLLAGIIEFGQAFRIQHMLSNASRRGARAAVVKTAKTIQIKKLVKTHCEQTLGVKQADVTVSIAVNGVSNGNLNQSAAGDEISLTVSIPYSKAGSGFYANMFSDSILTSTCTFEHE